MSEPASTHREPRYPRESDDWYVEPAWAVEELLNVEAFAGTVLDPACGSGTIPKVCLARGLMAVGWDLRNRGYGRAGMDFIRPATGTKIIDNVVMNPPYRVAQAFVDRACLAARRKVAVLVRLSFLESDTRRDWFVDRPPARVWVFPNRVCMPPGNSSVKRKGGKIPYCWIVWEHGYAGPTELGWLPVVEKDRR